MSRCDMKCQLSPLAFGTFLSGVYTTWKNKKNLNNKRKETCSKEPNWTRLGLTSVLKTPGRLWLLLLIVLWAMSQNNQTIIEDIITILIV
ncbi:MAG: hypothetical protein [Circular genetic element sp.]|nr:MAG: hypothetical protein [Circular genetic element sp.]